MLVIFVLFQFGPALRSFVENLSEFSVSTTGMSAKRTAIVAANLSAANERSADSRAGTNTIANVASDVTASLLRKAATTSILWVDDNPSNNFYERSALEALGISFVTSLNTEEAVRQLQNRSFDVVITDMSRPPDNSAGYTLLDELKRMKKSIPTIIYAASSNPQFIAEAIRRGAFGETNRPDELFKLVVDAVKSKQ